MPSSPAEILARRVAAAREAEANPAHWGQEPLSRDRADMLARRGVEVRTDRDGRISSALAGDVFDHMAGQGAITQTQLQAVRRLERDFAKRFRVGSKSYRFDVVDASSDPQAITDSQLDAASRIEAVLERVGPIGNRILRALIEIPMLRAAGSPGVTQAEQEDDWRAIVRSISGETNKVAQSCLVRTAVANLSEVYDAMDNRARSRPVATIATDPALLSSHPDRCLAEG